MNIEKLFEAEDDDTSRTSKGEGNRGLKSIDVEGFQKMTNILAGKEKFEGSIDSPQQMQIILDNIKKFKDELASDSKMGSGPAGALKKKLANLYSRIAPIQRILDRIKKSGKVSSKDSDIYDDFADEVEDILFQETYYKKFTPSETGASGGKANKLVFTQSFPIQFTSDDGKKHYGLVRPPSGVITWQGEASETAVRNDPTLKMPVKFPLIQNKIMKNKEIAALLKSSRIVVKDDDETKEDTTKILKKAGASINEKGDINGMQKALNSVEFWKNIAKIFR
jgi:hypothetical protein